MIHQLQEIVTNPVAYRKLSISPGDALCNTKHLKLIKTVTGLVAGLTVGFLGCEGLIMNGAIYVATMITAMYSTRMLVKLDVLAPIEKCKSEDNDINIFTGVFSEMMLFIVMWIVGYDIVYLFKSK